MPVRSRLRVQATLVECILRGFFCFLSPHFPHMEKNRIYRKGSAFLDGIACTRRKRLCKSIHFAECLLPSVAMNWWGQFVPLTKSSRSESRLRIFEVFCLIFTPSQSGNYIIYAEIPLFLHLIPDRSDLFFFKNL